MSKCPTMKDYSCHCKGRQHVGCDTNCGAFTDPQTVKELIEALEHWEGHGYLSGCSHGN